MNEDLQWALDEILSNAPRYRRAREYYDGRHAPLPASEKMREAFGRLICGLVDNLSPVVVETVADRLAVAGFSFSEEGQTKPLESTSREIWRRNRMNQRGGEVHQDALVDGDAYVIVWPGADRKAVLYPNRAARVAISYDDEMPGYITRAAKVWDLPDRKWRVNLYYRDRIEKWISRGELQGGLSDKAGQFVMFEDEEGGATIANPFDKVPVFHFGNRASVGELGRSELHEAIPLQDALNKSIADMLVAMEFYALPQRWATGLQDEEGGKVRAGGLWAVATADTRFGEFATGDIAQFLQVSEGFRKEIARVTRTPLHYFTLEGNFPSGEAQKTADAPLLAKIADRQVAWGNTWADVMRFAVRVEGGTETDPETVWRDLTPRNMTELVEIAKGKRELGVSGDQTLRELGYEQKDIDRFREERATLDVIPDVGQ